MTLDSPENVGNSQEKHEQNQDFIQNFKLK